MIWLSKTVTTLGVRAGLPMRCARRPRNHFNESLDSTATTQIGSLTCHSLHACYRTDLRIGRLHSVPDGLNAVSLLQYQFLTEEGSSCKATQRTD